MQQLRQRYYLIDTITVAAVFFTDLRKVVLSNEKSKA